MHKGAGSQTVCAVVREIRLPEHMQAGDVAHEVVVHPETTHRVMHSRVDAHRTLVGIFTGDVLIHLEEVAVAFLDGFLTETLDGIREIQINTEPAWADSPALVAGLFGRARRNVAGREVAVARVFALEEIIAIIFGDG